MPDIGFPENVLVELKAAFDEHMDDFEVINRPLRVMDPAKSIGLFLLNWHPLTESQQIGQEEPALSRYDYRIQILIKSSDEILARSLFGNAQKSVRAILYRDHDLAVRLLGLIEEILGSRETLKRYGMTRQSFANNELQGQFVYLTTTELWVETEVVQL